MTTTGRMPEVGTLPPDFALPSTSGNVVILSSYRGKSAVLLAFFPLAFTGVCTAEMCDFSTDFPKFERLHAKVFGISVDSVPTLNEFKSKYDITVDLLSDFKREVAREFGVLWEELYFARRAYFIIGRDGRVAWRHLEDDLGHKRDNDELLAELEQL